ncbi:probable ATP-dependent RNA helicase ddx5 [Phoenix dactylifera]|uniref:Probable ATP-dependent RNA helicase ddx5 n=1 Tax=Phoenix dactylifera TaxID=42345 RepID=A0A8B9AJV9_PHODC|nr:probable ATP-dependent RNA helicase ddx5 [Phoenix dactylifera]
MALNTCYFLSSLKSCEPEFVVSTPDRLLDLVSLRAIDISSTSLLVIDGLKKFLDLGFVDKLYSIRDSISGHPQMVLFSDSYGEALKPVMQNLLRRPLSRLSLYDSSASQSAFISQYVYFCTSEEDKLLKAIRILAQVCA